MRRKHWAIWATAARSRIWRRCCMTGLMRGRWIIMGRCCAFAIWLRKRSNACAAVRRSSMLNLRTLFFALLVFFPALVLAQNSPQAGGDWVSFAPPVDSFTADAGFDLRSSNEAVAGEGGFIAVKGSHFVHSQ